MSFDEIQHIGLVAPAFLDLDLQVEEDLRIQDLLHLFAGLDAYCFDQAAMPADNDLAVIVPFSEMFIIFLFTFSL